MKQIRAQKMGETAQRVLSLPPDLFIMITAKLCPRHIRKLAKIEPKFIENLVRYEATEEARRKDALACFSCLLMHPEWKFADIHRRGVWGREGEKMRDRVCIKCLVKRPVGEKGPQRGVPFKIGDGYFVKCRAFRHVERCRSEEMPWTQQGARS